METRKQRMKLKSVHCKIIFMNTAILVVRYFVLKKQTRLKNRISPSSLSNNSNRETSMKISMLGEDLYTCEVFFFLIVNWQTSNMLHIIRIVMTRSESLCILSIEIKLKSLTHMEKLLTLYKTKKIGNRSYPLACVIKTYPCGD